MSDRATAPQTTEVGATGLNISAGYVFEEWDRRLQQRNGPKAWREMADADPTVGALLAAFEGMIRQAGYRITPADESTAAQEAADFVDSCLQDMEGAWGDTVSELLTCLPFGFALFEVVYKRRVAGESAHDDGKVGWAAWSPRAQETIVRWDVDPRGRAVTAYQVAPPDYREVAIPLDRCLHIRARSRKRNPEGQSILRQAYEPWFYAKNIRRLEAIGVERDLAGLPKVTIPAKEYNNPVTRATWERLVTDIRRDEQAGVLLPSEVYANGTPQYDLELMSTGGSRQIETDPIIARYERNILRSILADFLTLGDSGVGSYAQSVSRTDLFLAIVTSYCDSIADPINGPTGIPRLLGYNGVDPKLTPTFAFNSVTRRDIKTFADVIVALAGAGMVNAADPELRKHVYEIVDLPIPDDDAALAWKTPGELAAEAMKAAGNQPAKPGDDEDDDAKPGDRQKFAEPDPLWPPAFAAARERMTETLGKDVADLLDAEVAR